MFDQAKLAVVAYAEVSGTDGSSTRTNSGIATTRLALGTYQLSLPVASQNQIGLEQFSDRDLVFVTALNAATPISITAVNNGGTPAVPGASPTNKLVLTGTSATTAADTDFAVMILRTLTPPVLGGPA